MATLSQGIQRYGTNLQSTALTLTGSIFAVGVTTVFVLDSSGSYKSWQNGRSSFLNTTSSIPAYTAFQIIPGASITTDDAKLSFGTVISGGGTSSINRLLLEDGSTVEI
jgi:hypothetical protein